MPKVENQQGNGLQAGNWWGDLGYPNSTGSQNGTSYAIFNGIGRLAIQQNGKVIVFNTLDHQIGGVGQQQGGDYSVTFTSQYGTVNLHSLPIVSGGENKPAPQQQTNNNNNIIESPQTSQAPTPMPVASNNNSHLEEDIFDKIERLAGLKDKNILSVEEFESKKADLLSRL